MKMNIPIFGLILAAIPSITATASVSDSARFKANVKVVNSQMSSLASSISDVRAQAQLNKHTRIIAKCDEASTHLKSAGKSWGTISMTYSMAPWNAGLSTHGIAVRGSMDSCGKALQWIYAQPEVKAKGYTQPIAFCKSSYDSCQSGCGRLWRWSAPHPKPSQSHNHGGYGHTPKPTAPASCPGTETACPISSGYGSGTECLDIKTDVRSCGGCVSQGKGENCLKILGADGVGCTNGKCVVLSTHVGYSLTASGRPHKK